MIKTLFCDENDWGEWGIVLILCIIYPVSHLSEGFMEANLFPEKGNVWEYLAKEMLNVTEFCLGGWNGQGHLSNLFLGVATHPQAIQNFTRLRDFRLVLSYSTIFDWEPNTEYKDRTMFTLYTATVTKAASCFRMKGCTPSKTPDCKTLDNSALTCNHTEVIPFTYRHIKLSLGWFILCGTKAYSYILPTPWEGLAPWDG